ncbi:lanthionine synthetase LanC family protein, partial [Streptococcus pyogenes]
NILLSTYKSIQELDNFDIIGGLSGILAVLIKIVKVMIHSAEIEQLANSLAREIVERLITIYEAQGYWVENDPGFAHG